MALFALPGRLVDRLLDRHVDWRLGEQLNIFQDLGRRKQNKYEDVVHIGSWYGVPLGSKVCILVALKII